MATWTTIPDSSIEPGKPIRSIDGIALRDNPIAIAEGATGAPRIEDAALDTTVTNAGRDWVLARTAAAGVGAVGTYAFLASSNTTQVSPGSTKAGSNLFYAGVFSSSTNFFGNVEGTGISSPAVAGTWRCMGFDDSTFSPARRGATLWLRIS